MLKRQFCMLKAQGRLPLDLPLRPMKDWLLAGKRVFLEREAETWKRWRKVSVAELTWDAKRGLELQETETERVILLSGQRVQDELRIPNVIVDTATDGDIQLLKEERLKLIRKFYDMIAELPKSYFGSTESLPEMCGRGPEVCSRVPEVCSRGPEVRSGGPEVRCRGPEVCSIRSQVCSTGPEVCSGVPEVSNAVGEVSSDTKKTEATGALRNTGNGLRKVVQLSTESRPEVCSSPEVCIGVPEVFSGGPEVCSGVPDMCSGVPEVFNGGPEVCRGSPEVFSEVPEAPNAVEEVSSDKKKTAAAENLLDTENVLSNVVNPKGWLKEGWEDQLHQDFTNMIAKLPKSYFGSTESLPEVCSRGPEASNAVEEVCSDTKKTESTGNHLKTGNGLSKVLKLSTENRPEVYSSPEVCIGVPEVFSGGPEVCSGVPDMCSGVPEVFNGGPVVCRGSPEVFSEVPEAPNAVEEVSSDKKKTAAAENLLNTGNGLSKVMQLSTESCPEVSSGVTEALNSVAKVSSETKKRKKNGVLRFFRRVLTFFTCTISLPKEE
ncbi:uncharacterized protein LOC123482308 [Coregonus clupeaformis]|uniref:uncharacterized protein LOC123482308 n=1 Tax=Coregonus clupeaformis TaxID=59861 RepID=UPI001E1C603D|nr:uncharacterized protein LOC123482308 [Coregonus clupeaformis]XP_045065545.1 uncharacterized protein LOC123482308 [Coregonus clupeaformis]